MNFYFAISWPTYKIEKYKLVLAASIGLTWKVFILTLFNSFCYSVILSGYKMIDGGNANTIVKFERNLIFWISRPPYSLPLHIILVTKIRPAALKSNLFVDCCLILFLFEFHHLLERGLYQRGAFIRQRSLLGGFY